MRFEKAQWCDAARAGMRDAFGPNGPDEVQGWIESGRCELWRIDDVSWIVTEIRRPVLFVWCMQGRNAIGVMESLMKIAQKNRLEVIQFHTFRVGFLRLFERFGIVDVDKDDDGMIVCEVPA